MAKMKCLHSSLWRNWVNDPVGSRLRSELLPRESWAISPNMMSLSTIRLLKTLTAPDSGVSYLTATESYAFIPPILSLLQLKRTSASQISSVPGKGAYRIGAEIPPVRWITVATKNSRRKLALRPSLKHRRNGKRRLRPAFGLSWNRSLTA